jgi:hypothetical protein
MTNLIEVVHWERMPLPGDAAIGKLDLVVGQVGGGHPIGLVVAGIHGDEGPWGAWAIHKLLQNTTVDEPGTCGAPAANPGDGGRCPQRALDVLDQSHVSK